MKMTCGGWRTARRALVAARALGLGVLALSEASSVARAQSGAGSREARRLTIPFLAPATRPSHLEFEAASCDITAAGDQMACRFQQVFLTVSTLDAQTCLVTTNRYDRVFRRETPTRWVSANEVPGECGLVDTVTLDDGGGVKWTMSVRTVVTRKDAAPVCRQVDEAPEVFSWQGLKRPLPCTSIQPGDLAR